MRAFLLLLHSKIFFTISDVRQNIYYQVRVALACYCIDGKHARMRTREGWHAIKMASACLPTLGARVYIHQYFIYCVCPGPHTDLVGLGLGPPRPQKATIRTLKYKLPYQNFAILNSKLLCYTESTVLVLYCICEQFACQLKLLLRGPAHETVSSGTEAQFWAKQK